MPQNRFPLLRIKLQLDDVRRNESPLARCVSRIKNAPGPDTILHRGDISIELSLGFAIDYRADMGGGIARVADLQLARRACNHLDHPVSYIVLHAEQPQRRAALPGGAEG